MLSFDAAVKVLKPFYLDPSRGYYLREISRNCDFSYERVHKWANELEKEGVLVSEKRGKIKEYKINKSSEVVAKMFALHDIGKRNSFLEKRPAMKKAVFDLREQLIEKVSEVIESILISDKALGGKEPHEIEIYLLANQPLSIQTYTEIERICKQCSKDYNFLIYADTVPQFRTKWIDDKEYRKMWMKGILLYGEESFWQEFLKMGRKLE